MFDPNNIFNALFVIPILNALIALYKGLQIVSIPGALGFAIILLTVFIRLLLHPLTTAQLKSAQKMQKMKPHLDKLNALHKDDKARLRQEQLKLYQEAGINPAAGCLPLLLQLPILIALYNLFFTILNSPDLAAVVSQINHVVYHPSLQITSLDLSFFGIHLAAKPSDWQQSGWWLLLIPVITAALQYWQTKLMTPGAKIQEEQKTKHIEKKVKHEEQKKPEEDMATAMQKQMAIMMPLMIGFFAYSFPVGLSLYWNTFTIFGIIQQQQVNKKS